jgi:hypothetical protein
MPDRICALFCVPPIAVARLGGSSTPMAAYRWQAPADPRTEGETVIAPDWTLEMLADGSVDPTMPAAIQFRDGDLIRPACPFIEVWARVGDPALSSATWREERLTPALLTTHGGALSDLRFSIDAQNRKAARRTGRPALGFGTTPPLMVAGDDHNAHALEGRSPAGPTPMIPAARQIPLGRVQIMRPRAQPASGAAPWAHIVRVDVVRLRYTPARGLFYGPPEAANATDASPVPAVQTANAFLDPAAGWRGADRGATRLVVPADTVDTITENSPRSLGVVDDTCELRIEVMLGGTAGPLATHANIFVAPPDFGPDRRPFLSIADEINDRAADSAARNAGMSRADLDFWVADLFERVYETASLLNLDFWRRVRGIEGIAPADAAVPNDSVAPSNQAMGSLDPLRNRTLRVAPATDADPLPLSAHMRERHRTLSDLDFLRKFVFDNPGRLRQLIRAAFEVEVDEDPSTTTMRMPPFMRQSNALPLTISAWQYDLLMRWVNAVTTGPQPGVLAADSIAPPRASAAEAEVRRAEVLARLDTEAVSQ